MGMSFSERFTTRLLPTLATFVAGGISFYLLSAAMQCIPVGTAYAVWTAIGAVTLGILFLGDPADLLRLAGITFVLSGVAMPRLAEA